MGPSIDTDKRLVLHWRSSGVWVGVLVLWGVILTEGNLGAIKLHQIERMRRGNAILKEPP